MDKIDEKQMEELVANLTEKERNLINLTIKFHKLFNETFEENKNFTLQSDLEPVEKSLGVLQQYVLIRAARKEKIQHLEKIFDIDLVK